MSMEVMATKRTVAWFRNDLRIFDNPALHAAASHALKERTELACVYCFDPSHFKATKYSAHKTGIYRSKFLIESVSNLRENLRSIGGDLFVAIAKPEELLLHIACGGVVFAQAEVTSEEISVENKVQRSCGNLSLVLGGNTLHHPDDLPYARDFSDLPAVFTNYRQRVEKLGVKVRPVLPALKRGSLPKSPAPASIALNGTPLGLAVSTGTSTGPVAPASAMQCGFDYLPTLAELGFSQQEIDAYAQATASADVLYGMRTVGAILLPASPSAPAPASSNAPPAPPTPPAPPALPAPSALPMPRLAHPAGVMPFIGGETAALQRLQTWMFDDDHLKDYFDIRNGMLGEGYSTKLSPWLALGCISPRHIYHESKRYERERGIANKSTYWLTFELLVRDFFRFYCVQHGATVFWPYGPMTVIQAAKQQARPTAETIKKGGKYVDKIAPAGTVLPVGKPKPTAQCLAKLRAEYGWSSTDLAAIARWKLGQTGQPLVDANMRELLLTGWMSNRGRQNVASYLIHDLHVDWRIGAAHFEEFLLDHDVCSNYGNWNAAAGLSGEGKRVNKFNCVKQSKDYDPAGRYLRHWLPELRDVPAPMIFTPPPYCGTHLKQQQRRGKGSGGSQSDGRDEGER